MSYQEIVRAMDDPLAAIDKVSSDLATMSSDAEAYSKAVSSLFMIAGQAKKTGNKELDERIRRLALELVWAFEFESSLFGVVDVLMITPFAFLKALL